MVVKGAVPLLGIVALVSYPLVSFAQQCPPELAQAKSKIASAQAAMSKPPRSAAGYQGREQQAPRAQDQQAPRGQEFQAPRGQEQQAPRAQDQQAPRGQ